MAQPIKDCSCEDWPCCEHADNFPTEPEYCDICGYTYYAVECPFCNAPYDPSEDDDGSWEDNEPTEQTEPDYM